MNKTSLNKIAKVTAGNVAPAKDNFTETGYPFVRAGSLSGLLSGDDIQTLEKLDDAAATKLKMKLFPAGTVVFAKSGMSCLKGYVYTLPRDCFVVSHLACVIPDAGHSKFLEHFFRRVKPNRLIENPSFPSIKLSKISAIEVPLLAPGLEDSIVKALDGVEHLKTLEKDFMRKLDELVKSRFNCWEVAA